MDRRGASRALIIAAALLFFPLLFTGNASAALDFNPLIGVKPLEGVPMGGIFANERINIYIENVAAGNIVLSDGTITDAGITPLQDPTMNIYASAETALKIVTGQKTMGQCFLDGDIRYEGVGVAGSFKAFFAGIGIWLYSLFN
jgi:hypothetical protein